MKLGIIGAGAWGSALAVALANNFEEVIIYAIEESVVDDINNNNINTQYLKEYQLEKNIKATLNPEGLKDCQILLLTTPTQFIRETIRKFSFLEKSSIILICSKGLEISSKRLISQVVEEELPAIKNNIGVLGGPTFAFEVAKGLPMTLLLTMKDINRAKKVAQILKTSNIRIYYSDDVIGSQIGGAIKNIIAIASGIIKGADLGHNALAGLITRGLQEIAILNSYFGGRKETIFGLSGLGDLTLTATSSLSRNFSLGFAIGKNGSYNDDLKETLKGVPEGFYTVKALYDILKETSLAMPITKEVYAICYENKSIEKSLNDLMGRAIREEI